VLMVSSGLSKKVHGISWEPLTCPNAYGKAEYMPAALSR
jgi:hypothetical protein